MFTLLTSIPYCTGCFSQGNKTRKRNTWHIDWKGRSKLKTGEFYRMYIIPQWSCLTHFCYCDDNTWNFESKLFQSKVNPVQEAEVIMCGLTSDYSFTRQPWTNITCPNISLQMFSDWEMWAGVKIRQHRISESDPSGPEGSSLHSDGCSPDFIVSNLEHGHFLLAELLVSSFSPHPHCCQLNFFIMFKYT